MNRHSDFWSGWCTDMLVQYSYCITGGEYIVFFGEGICIVLFFEQIGEDYCLLRVYREAADYG